MWEVAVSYTRLKLGTTPPKSEKLHVASKRGPTLGRAKGSRGHQDQLLHSMARLLRHDGSLDHLEGVAGLWLERAGSKSHCESTGGSPVLLSVGLLAWAELPAQKAKSAA